MRLRPPFPRTENANKPGAGLLEGGAFTLVETLVAIAVLTVLIALVAPALSNARQAADRTHSLAKLRNLGHRFGAYSADFADAFPYSTRETLHPITAPGYAIAFGHFQVTMSWPLMMPDLIAAGHASTAPHLAPKVTRQHVTVSVDQTGKPIWLTSSYAYGLSFVADPAVWVEGVGASDALLRPVRTHETIFPARKVLLWDAFTPYLLPPPGGFGWDRSDIVPMLFVDGHATQLVPGNAQMGAHSTVFPHLPVGGRRLRDTPGGVRGFDY